MHPVERLRWVNQARGIDHRELVAEVVASVASLRRRTDEMIPIARSALERSPSTGALWSALSRVLGAVDVVEEARRITDELFLDRTDDAFTQADTTDVVAFSVDAAGFGDEPGGEAGGGAGDRAGAGFLAPRGVLQAVAGAGQAGLAVWAVAPVGVVLPRLLWDEAVRRSTGGGGGGAGDGGDASAHGEAVDFIPAALVARVVRETGPAPTEAALRRADCAEAPELLRRHDAPGSWRPGDGGRRPYRW